jgi:hypothetical protein
MFDSSRVCAMATVHSVESYSIHDSFVERLRLNANAKVFLLVKRNMKQGRA